MKALTVVGVISLMLVVDVIDIRLSRIEDKLKLSHTITIEDWWHGK